MSDKELKIYKTLFPKRKNISFMNVSIKSLNTLRLEILTNKNIRYEKIVKLTPRQFFIVKDRIIESKYKCLFLTKELNIGHPKIWSKIAIYNNGMLTNY